MQAEVLNTAHLTVMAAEVEDLIMEEFSDPENRLMKQRCQGVVLGIMRVTK